MDAGRLFAEHYASLYRYLVRMTGDGDAAADAAAEAFGRLVERPPARDENPRAWLYKVATNAVREAARTQSRRLRLLEGGAERGPHGDAPAPPDEALEARRRHQAVQSALAGLPERDRTILLMREEGFAHREIAEAVGTTTKSVGTLIARALDRLGATIDLDAEDLQ